MAGWESTFSNREYIDSKGGFSIAMLVYWRVATENGVRRFTFQESHHEQVL